MYSKGVISTILASTTTWGVINGEHLRSAGKLKQGSTDPARKLQHQGSSSCSLEDETREAGQWLRGPELTCQCDRYGTGSWVGCVDNEQSRNVHTGTDANLDTAMGRRGQFDEKDFVFDLLGSVPASITPAGTVQPLDVENMPALAGEGVSYSLFNIEPCGINLPHVHPRATELLYVISGKDLRTAFTEENGGRVIVNDIGMGEATFFPEGLIHYQQNLSCNPVTYISALNSEDPGVITITTQFFRLPTEALQGALNENKRQVQQLIDGLPGNPAEGRQACMAACGWATEEQGLLVGAM